MCHHADHHVMAAAVAGRQRLADRVVIAEQRARQRLGDDDGRGRAVVTVAQLQIAVFVVEEIAATTELQAQGVDEPVADEAADQQGRAVGGFDVVNHGQGLPHRRTHNGRSALHSGNAGQCIGAGAGL
ncbi:hypothetical protein D9M71_665690 [compost metagenome]